MTTKNLLPALHSWASSKIETAQGETGYFRAQKGPALTQIQDSLCGPSVRTSPQVSFEVWIPPLQNQAEGVAVVLEGRVVSFVRTDYDDAIPHLGIFVAKAGRASWAFDSSLPFPATAIFTNYSLKKRSGFVTLHPSIIAKLQKGETTNLGVM